MFRSKKTPQRTEKRDLSQFGLMNVSMDDADNSGDSDYEAELLALTSGGGRPVKPARKPKPAVNVDSMVAESLRDDSGGESSVDENDPELLGELNELTGAEGAEGAEEAPPPPTQAAAPTASLPKLLAERLDMYVKAEENAKKAGEISRARRFSRGIKTLKDLLKQASAGRPINEEDIPPEVSLGTGKPREDVQPSRPAPPPPPAAAPAAEEEAPPEEETQPEPGPSQPPAGLTEKQQAVLELLQRRRDEYRSAAMSAKKSDDMELATKFVKTMKQFDRVIAAAEAGSPIDLSNMPGPPGQPKEAPKPPEEAPRETMEVQAEAEDVPEPDLITAGSVLEALEQRLKVYKEQEDSAKEAGNSSKARRMGRIVKQFEVAIKQHKAGKAVDFDELPTPPGYAPIPGTEKPPVEQEDKPPEQPEPPRERVPASSGSGPSQPSPQGTKIGNLSLTTRAGKQLQTLLQRQTEFKEAALSAKKKGEIAQAKEFLRLAKGFEPLIKAAESGLPVDMNTLPIPATARSALEDSFQIVVAEECTEDETGSLEALVRMENQLSKQLKLCLSTRDHHKALGDVAGTNRFEQLALEVTRDLDVVRIAHRMNSEPPKFRYETRSFSVVKCYPDIGDDELELNVLRGINYKCPNPKEVDTYVRLEVPFPQEEPFKEKTILVKDTNNPEYNASFTVPIERSARACQRVFKRHAVKLEVFSRGGLFRSDTSLGVANIKLQPLETKCEIHDSFDLFNGRKPTGGKLEVRLRLRHPLLTREVQQLTERWLVII